MKIRTPFHHTVLHPSHTRSTLGPTLHNRVPSPPQLLLSLVDSEWRIYAPMNGSLSCFLLDERAPTPQYILVNPIQEISPPPAGQFQQVDSKWFQWDVHNCAYNISAFKKANMFDHWEDVKCQTTPKQRVAVSSTPAFTRWGLCVPRRVKQLFQSEAEMNGLTLAEHIKEQSGFKGWLCCHFVDNQYFETYTLLVWCSIDGKQIEGFYSVDTNVESMQTVDWLIAWTGSVITEYTTQVNMLPIEVDVEGSSLRAFLHPDGQVMTYDSYGTLSLTLQLSWNGVSLLGYSNKVEKVVQDIDWDPRIPVISQYYCQSKLVNQQLQDLLSPYMSYVDSLDLFGHPRQQPKYVYTYCTIQFVNVTVCWDAYFSFVENFQSPYFKLHPKLGHVNTDRTTRPKGSRSLYGQHTQQQVFSYQRQATPSVNFQVSTRIEIDIPRRNHRRRVLLWFCGDNNKPLSDDTIELITKKLNGQQYWQSNLRTFSPSKKSIAISLRGITEEKLHKLFNTATAGQIYGAVRWDLQQVKSDIDNDNDLAPDIELFGIPYYYYEEEIWRWVVEMVDQIPNTTVTLSRLKLIRHRNSVIMKLEEITQQLDAIISCCYVPVTDIEGLKYQLAHPILADHNWTTIEITCAADGDIDGILEALRKRHIEMLDFHRDTQEQHTFKGYLYVFKCYDCAVMFDAERVPKLSQLYDEEVVTPFEKRNHPFVTCENISLRATHNSTNVAYLLTPFEYTAGWLFTRKNVDFEDDWYAEFLLPIQPTMLPIYSNITTTQPETSVLDAMAQKYFAKGAYNIFPWEDRWWLVTLEKDKEPLFLEEVFQHYVHSPVHHHRMIDLSQRKRAHKYLVQQYGPNFERLNAPCCTMKPIRPYGLLLGCTTKTGLEAFRNRIDEEISKAYKTASPETRFCVLNNSHLNINSSLSLFKRIPRNVSEGSTSQLCPYCFDDCTDQQVWVLPCGHLSCVPCLEDLFGRTLYKETNPLNICKYLKCRAILEVENNSKKSGSQATCDTLIGWENVRRFMSPDRFAKLVCNLAKMWLGNVQCNWLRCPIPECKGAYMKEVKTIDIAGLSSETISTPEKSSPPSPNSSGSTKDPETPSRSDEEKEACSGTLIADQIPFHICGDCGERICRKCGQGHPEKVSCTTWAELKGEDMQLWLAGSPDTRKLCTHCKTPIEKLGGCNHMECSRCRGHFCWQCDHLTFKTAGEVYRHMAEAHNQDEDEADHAGWYEFEAPL